MQAAPQRFHARLSPVLMTMCIAEINSTLGVERVNCHKVVDNPLNAKGDICQIIPDSNHQIWYTGWIDSNEQTIQTLCHRKIYCRSGNFRGFKFPRICDLETCHEV